MRDHKRTFWLVIQAFDHSTLTMGTGWTGYATLVNKPLTMKQLRNYKGYVTPWNV